MPDPDMKLGFIGLGLMGRPMTFNLLKAGRAVAVWNRSAEKCAPLAAARCRTRRQPGGGDPERLGRDDLPERCRGGRTGRLRSPTGSPPARHRAGCWSICPRSALPRPALWPTAWRGETGMRWIDAPVFGRCAGRRTGEPGDRGRRAGRGCGFGSADPGRVQPAGHPYGRRRRGPDRKAVQPGDRVVQSCGPCRGSGAG